jgi:iron complex outermembrane recepter protein
MKHVLFLYLSLLSLTGFAQQPVSGTVRDITTNEPLVGAVVLVDNGKAVANTNVDGFYKIMLADGEHTLEVKYTGYKSDPIKVKVAGKPVTVNFTPSSSTLKEVEISADLAIDRKTPIAFSNVSQVKIQEEGAGRDMTMLLNSTPGAYATQQGGGQGDSRVNLRGFDQRNIAVMVDGVPVNDMENGQVYWSNWDGLSEVTRTMQVQRGLGASRLAIPSVGGTINILSKGIDEKQQFILKKEYGSFAQQKLVLGFNSGEFGKGWGVTFAGSRTTGDGWANQTWTDAWSYFFKVQKRYEKHLFTLGANGAPQSHGQRSDRMPVAIYDGSFANSLGINSDSLYATNNGYTTAYQGERGLRFNPHAGMLNKGDGQERVFNERTNYYHKPQFNFSWFWAPTEKLTINTIVYLSIGKGGGARLNSGIARDTTTGLLLYSSVWNSNTTTIDGLYSTTETKSTRYINSSVNNHFWYGGLATANLKVSEKTNVLFGFDHRFYKGEHYRMVYDLIGGDYVIDNSDRNQPNGVGNLQYAMKRKGDKISYYNDGLVWWDGFFAQGEYKGEKFSTFLTATGSITSYQRIDYFRKRDVTLADGEKIDQIVGYNEVYYTNGTQSAVAQNNAVITTSGDTTYINNPSGADYAIANATAYKWEDAKTSTTKKKTLPGLTIKTGANYNFNDHYNVFVNVGYMNMAPRFNNVFDNNNKEFLDIQNQNVYAAEVGAGARFPYFAANLNLYYTYWANKPPQFTPTINVAGDIFSYNINGMDAIHRGVEMDFTWKPMKGLDVEGLVAIADWRNNSAKKAYIYDAQEVLVDSVEFDAKGVHVGDAAQTQIGGSIRWSPVKGFWMKARYTYFGRNFANYDPLTLVVTYNSNGDVISDNRQKESWITPSYGIFDFFTGYEFRGTSDENAARPLRVGLTLGVTNILNTTYISDAQNGANFDASSALVYVGLGRRFNAGIRFTF